MMIRIVIVMIVMMVMLNHIYKAQGNQLRFQLFAAKCGKT